MIGLSMTGVMPAPTELRSQHAASDVPFTISPMTSEGMNCPRSCYYLAAVRHTARNQKLLTSLDGDAFSINQQCVATLHNQHVLIKFMEMLCGSCGLSASPKRHLAPIGSVEDVSFDTGGRLIRPNDPVRGVPHELRKAVHAGACYRKAAVAVFRSQVITIYHQTASHFSTGQESNTLPSVAVLCAI
jgi:hypothetical protein